MLEEKLANPAKKFLKNCERGVYLRIKNRITELCINPFPSEAIKVQGRKEKVFRVRVGDYRILYVVFPEENILLVVDIDKRSRVYN